MSRHLSEEHKQWLSENRKGKNNPFYGRKHTKETCEKMSVALRGKNHPIYGQHLSDETKKKLSEINKGEKNPFYGKKHTKKSCEKIAKANKGKGLGKDNSNWNSNLTEEERSLNRHGCRNKDWSKKVRKKDNYICQCCGVSDTTMEAHHMENFHNNPNLRLDVNNGITFCTDCHVQFHKTYGVHNTTAQQTKEFIYNYRLKK